MNRKLGGCAPFGGELRPHLTQRRLGRGLSPYQVALDPSSRLATIDMGQKLGGVLCHFLWGSWIPIEHKVVWAEAYLHTKWHLSHNPSIRLATTDIGRKLGGCAPLGDGKLGPHLTMLPRLTPTSIRSGILIHTAIWPQQTWVEKHQKFG